MLKHNLRAARYKRDNSGMTVRQQIRTGSGFRRDYMAGDAIVSASRDQSPIAIKQTTNS